VSAVEYILPEEIARLTRLFAAVLAHEIHNLLGAIAGSIDLLRTGGEAIRGGATSSSTDADRGRRRHVFERRHWRNATEHLTSAAMSKSPAVVAGY
jgi:signal transduction histidine kinase